ncbi:MAG TPA: hypothetical protein VG742_10660 [Dongiaceae bacterium]|nr:hypothetical protein [Dongiaceae bacterium]
MAVPMNLRRRRTLFNTIILATVILGGLWLFLGQMPHTQSARERKCVEQQRRVLSAAYIRLREGDTWEAFEGRMLAYCACFAREISRQLSPEELAVLDREQSTPAIDAKVLAAKVLAVNEGCRPETP